MRAFRQLLPPFWGQTEASPTSHPETDKAEPAQQKSSLVDNEAVSSTPRRELAACATAEGDHSDQECDTLAVMFRSKPAVSKLFREENGRQPRQNSRAHIDSAADIRSRLSTEPLSEERDLRNDRHNSFLLAWAKQEADGDGLGETWRSDSTTSQASSGTFRDEANRQIQDPLELSLQPRVRVPRRRPSLNDGPSALSPSGNAGHETTLGNSSSRPPRGRFKWKRGDLVGRGSFGVVHLALSSEDGQMMAVKSIPLAPKGPGVNLAAVYAQATALRHQINAMQALDHPNIARYLGTQLTSDMLFQFVEFVPQGNIASLVQRFGSFSSMLAQRYTWQVLLGLHYLHSNGWVHGRLHASNVLVASGGVCKLVGYGMQDDLEQLRRLCGAPASDSSRPSWLAPDSAEGPSSPEAMDVWAIGSLVEFMLQGDSPAPEQPCTPEEPEVKAEEMPAPQRRLTILSSNALAFRDLCHHPDPNQRPTAAALLQHPFLAEHLRESGGEEGGAPQRLFPRHGTRAVTWNHGPEDQARPTRTVSMTCLGGEEDSTRMQRHQSMANVDALPARMRTEELAPGTESSNGSRRPRWTGRISERNSTLAWLRARTQHGFERKRRSDPKAQKSPLAAPAVASS